MIINSRKRRERAFQIAGPASFVHQMCGENAAERNDECRQSVVWCGCECQPSLVLLQMVILDCVQCVLGSF
jgi:hypothetical protein